MYIAASRVHANPTNFQASIVFQPVIAQRHSPFYERDRKLSHLTLHRNVVVWVYLHLFLTYYNSSDCRAVIPYYNTDCYRRKCCREMGQKISIDIFSQFAQCATPLFR